MVTLAPERPGAMAFIEKLAAAGVVVAIGHTAATGEQIRDAVAAGARTSTHLGNGAHAVLPRHANYIWEQLADDGLWASIIADGHHLPASVVKCVVRVEDAGAAALTCDAGSLAGMPPGRYREWGQELEVLPGGKIVVPGTPYLAGCGHFTDVVRRERRSASPGWVWPTRWTWRPSGRGNCSGCRCRRSSRGSRRTWWCSTGNRAAN